MEPTEELVIRSIEPTDSVDELTKLLHRAYREHAEQGRRFQATHQDSEITRRRIGSGECFVAILDGQIVGSIILVRPSKASPCPWHNHSDVAWMVQFAVDPDFRGKRIGSALVGAIERRARDLGAVELSLDTSERTIELIERYLHWGYRIVGHFYWPNTNYRSVVMSKRLREDKVVVVARSAWIKARILGRLRRLKYRLRGLFRLG